jgi:hypothetical protein
MGSTEGKRKEEGCVVPIIRSKQGWGKRENAERDDYELVSCHQNWKLAKVPNEETMGGNYFIPENLVQSSIVFD